MGLFFTTCLILISCALQASPLPLKSNLNDPSEDANNLPSDEPNRLNSFYYPVSSGNHYGRNTKPSESMELSASNYYPTNNDYAAVVTTLPSVDDFEFEKINPSDIKKINKTTDDVVENESKTNVTQASKFSKLLFSSPSATVTSNGPSGPFKAIICHDCENSEGRNVGHSVSFSAIKSWNVGSSNKAATQPEQDSNHSSVQQPPTHHPSLDELPLEKEPEKFYDEQSRDDENHQIEMNDKVELFKVENVPSETEKPSVPINTWNYSHLPINNENAKPIAQKKPIFNDLLKVPYDVLNRPVLNSQLAEPPTPEPVQGTQIHINHQQKFNDTITSNYQHFQQFIHKNLNANQHYQSTPMPEQNYEVDESVSLMTNGRAHGVQSTTSAPITSHHHLEEKNHNHQSNSPPPSSSSSSQDQEQDAKFGYVVEGRNFRKYRVEEKTADGFIVGEYGLLNNNDGSPIQGVRYTADSNINPRLIYDALLKFLSL